MYKTINLWAVVSSKLVGNEHPKIVSKPMECFIYCVKEKKEKTTTIVSALFLSAPMTPIVRRFIDLKYAFVVYKITIIGHKIPIVLLYMISFISWFCYTNSKLLNDLDLLNNLCSWKWTWVFQLMHLDNALMGERKLTFGTLYLPRKHFVWNNHNKYF